MVSAPGKAKPPGPPWKELTLEKPATGYLSVFLSDDLARYAIRDITRIADNKSDPNLETRSYGLFSTCEERMRASIVNRGIRYIFFLTSHRGAPRAVVGYYDVRWYTRGAVSDYALAATRIRFVDPIPVSTVVGALGAELQRRFRSYLRLDSERTAELLLLLRKQPDRTRDYLAEIDRLERISMRFTGYRYPSWRRENPFSWDDAAGWLPNEGDDALDVPNASPTGVWSCDRCADRIRSVARLKSCPNCGRLGTLRPEV